MGLFMIGMFCALLAAAVFLLLATFTALPVSTTHAIVGAVVGVTLAGAGGGCLNWGWKGGLGGIAASWIISPLFSGCIAAGLWLSLHRYVIRSPNPQRRALVAAPVIYGVSVAFIASMILIKSKVTKGMPG